MCLSRSGATCSLSPRSHLFPCAGTASWWAGSGSYNGRKLTLPKTKPGCQRSGRWTQADVPSVPGQQSNPFILFTFFPICFYWRNNSPPLGSSVVALHSAAPGSGLGWRFLLGSIGGCQLGCSPVPVCRLLGKEQRMDGFEEELRLWDVTHPGPAACADW